MSLGFFKARAFLLFLALALPLLSDFAKGANEPYNLQGCLDSCDKNYGYNGVYRSVKSLDAKILEECRKFGSAGVSDYASCQRAAFDSSGYCKKNCEFYRTDPCFGECEKDYAECARQCDYNYGIDATTCTETLVQQCIGACNDYCGKEGKKKDLACVNNSCQMVARTSAEAQKAGAVLSCSGKLEGHSCGSKIACIGNTCQMTDYAGASQESLCGGKEPGAKCCEPPSAGDCQKTRRHVKDIQVEIKSDWWAGTCKWTAYYWWHCAPYDAEKCQYDYTKEREQKFFLSFGSSNGLLDAIFCGWGVESGLKRERDDRESQGSGGVKG